MARKMENKVSKFKGLEDTPGIQDVEKIYKANEEARKQRVAEVAEKQQAQQPAQPEVVAPEAVAAPVATPAPASPSPMPSAKASKKTQNGITIYVPMDYYMQIIRIKMETGTPIKDIALQAVIEYLDRHKND